MTAALPKGCCRFTLIDGVLVTDFTCAGPVAALLRSNLLQVAQARSAALNKGEKLELLHRYLSGIEFRQRVEAIVEAFERMREDLDQERRAAERAVGEAHEADRIGDVQHLRHVWRPAGARAVTADDPPAGTARRGA